VNPISPLALIEPEEVFTNWTTAFVPSVGCYTDELKHQFIVN
jgi:hypothetical protein